MNVEKAIQNIEGKRTYKPIERKTMDVPETAEYLGVSQDFLYRMTRKKEIPHIKIGSRTMFRKNTIDEWLDQLESESLE